MENFVIKRLNSYDREQVLEHFLRLDPDSIYSRFCAPFREDAIKRHVDRIDFDENGIYGIFNDELEIIGVGECVITSNNGAEIGFSVEPKYQGNGLGGKLMKRMVRFAKSQNKDHLEMMCLRTNQKSVHLAKKFGLQVKNDAGESFAIINMEDNKPELENLNEKMEDTLAYYTLKHKEQLKNWRHGQELIAETVGKAVTTTLELMKPKFFR